MQSVPTIDLSGWRDDWLWALPLIMLTVVIHVLGLGLIIERGERILTRLVDHRHFALYFAVVTGAAVLLVTVLHGIEAVIWAAAYWALAALPDTRSAVLYSLSAMTTYGGTDIVLKHHWQLMGALEALNGIILFGLTTAFLFSMIQRVGLPSIRRRQERPK
jgi:hypothetical protein